MSRIHFIQGSARRLPLADRSVQCVVTSPPYFGLRSYGTRQETWGGQEDCRHEWESAGTSHKGGPHGASTQLVGRDTSGRDAAQTIQHGDTCRLCGAWRGELGAEPTPDLFVAHVVEVFREVRRVLRDDGVLFLNFGDSYANDGKWGGATGGKHATDLHGETGIGRAKRVTGLKAKDLIGIPWAVAFALRADGWYLRSDIIWHKPNPMPSSVTDRPTTGHEYVFLLTKSARYFYDADAIREPITSTGGASFGAQSKGETGKAQSRRLDSPDERNHPLGRNKRSVWTVPTCAFKGSHFATFPPRLIEPMILAGTSEKGCCPACGAPWKRVATRVIEHMSGSGVSGNPIAGKGKPGGEIRMGHDIRNGPTPRVITTGWKQGCDCPAQDPIPC